MCIYEGYVQKKAPVYSTNCFIERKRLIFAMHKNESRVIFQSILSVSKVLNHNLRPFLMHCKKLGAQDL